jgi:hypothetical protein
VIGGVVAAGLVAVGSVAVFITVYAKNQTVTPSTAGQPQAASLAAAPEANTPAQVDVLQSEPFDSEALESNAEAKPANTSSQQANASPGILVARPLVAPVFEHGKGRTTTAAHKARDVIALAQEDLLSVVNEELAPWDIKLGQLAIVRDVSPWVDPEEAYRQQGLDEAIAYLRPHRGPPKSIPPFRFTGGDSRKKIVVLIVCRANYYQLGGTVKDPAAIEYDFKGIAIAAQREIEKQVQQPVAIGVFYDPAEMANPGDAAESHAKGQPLPLLRSQRSQAMLRRQVQSFVAYLKEKGVL